MQHHEAAILTLLLNMKKNLGENEPQTTLALFPTVTAAITTTSPFCMIIVVVTFKFSEETKNKNHIHQTACQKVTYCCAALLHVDVTIYLRSLSTTTQQLNSKSTACQLGTKAKYSMLFHCGAEG